MKTLRAALLGLLLAGCATPLPSSTPGGSAVPTNVPTTAPSPSPSPTVVVRCITPISPQLGFGASPGPSPGYCSPSSVTAVLTAVAFLGYPVTAVTIGPFDFNCGGPFATGVRSCPAAIEPSLPAAYVSFAGTAKVAVVEIGTQRGGSVTAATVILAEVPPAGWSMPSP
jgi:hypothetical protein